MIDVSRFAGKASDYKRSTQLSQTTTVTEKHLQGKHDQRTHGGGGGVSAPRDTAHAKQKQAWELHEQGKTWEEVAKEAGYANGGAARLAGKAHEKRVKAKGEGAEVPKPTEVVTPKPKTDKEGAKAIKDAQALVDKATGGRTVADVMATERNSQTRTKEPSAKELEVTEAVIKSGAILRGEVDRRRASLGKDVVETAKSEVEVLKKDKALTQKRVDEVDAQRASHREKIDAEVMASPRLDVELNDRIDLQISKTKSERLIDGLDADRAGVIKEMREYNRLFGKRGEVVNADERDAWRKQRAKERFPDDKKAQEEYAAVLTEGRWGAAKVERSLEMSGGKMKVLKDEEDRLIGLFSEAVNADHAVAKEIRNRERLIKDGGVTPEQNAEIIRSVLIDSGRTMTDKPAQTLIGSKPAVAELRAELVKIPDELWSTGAFPRMNVNATSGRGHWSSSKAEIKTDGKKGTGRRASTLLHEATHAVEDMNYQIPQLEFVMSHRRAKGQQPQKLSDIRKGGGYRKDEVAIEDAWANPYSGKVYNGGGRRNNWEIMTMGIESLYKRQDYPHDIADEDHLNFVMGVLAYA